VTSILGLNALPFGVRDPLYLRLIPEELLTRLGRDRQWLHSAGAGLVRVSAGEDKPWARIEVKTQDHHRDPVLLVDVSTSAFGVPELSLVQINDPDAPRYGIDRDHDGNDTLLGTASRNLAEETRALADGLAPGQVRRGLGMLRRVLECMDAFCLLLDAEFYLVEPLFYHSALQYERHGCDYFMGRDRMEEIHASFAPGGRLCGRLDDSTPFRRRGFEATIRGRSWAIHDGILGAPFSDTATAVKMFRVPGRNAGVATFPDAAY
jgi:hypothetical protein